MQRVVHNLQFHREFGRPNGCTYVNVPTPILCPTLSSTFAQQDSAQISTASGSISPQTRRYKWVAEGLMVAKTSAISWGEGLSALDPHKYISATQAPR